MDSSRSLLFFVLPSIFNLLAPTLAQFDNRTCTSAAEYCWICSDTAGNYTPGDMYHSNLQRIFSSFSSDTRSSSGFYNFSAGQDSNKVNAIALCRGDLALGDCRTCVNESSHILLHNCSNHKEAILWGERCMVRYSHNVIFGIEQKVPTKFLPGPNLAENAQQFEVVLDPLLGILSEKAASGDSLKICGRTCNCPECRNNICICPVHSRYKPAKLQQLPQRFHLNYSGMLRWKKRRKSS